MMNVCVEDCMTIHLDKMTKLPLGYEHLLGNNECLCRKLYDSSFEKITKLPLGYEQPWMRELKAIFKAKQLFMIVKSWTVFSQIEHVLVELSHKYLKDIKGSLKHQEVLAREYKIGHESYEYVYDRLKRKWAKYKFYIGLKSLF